MTKCVHVCNTKFTDGSKSVGASTNNVDENNLSFEPIELRNVMHFFISKNFLYYNSSPAIRSRSF